MQNQNEDNSPFAKIQRRNTMLMKRNSFGFFDDYNPSQFPPQFPEKKENPFVLRNNMQNPFSLFNQFPEKNSLKIEEKDNLGFPKKEEPKIADPPKQKKNPKSSRKKYYCEMCRDFFPTIDKHIERSYP